MYVTPFKRDDKNRHALEALGHLSRDEGDNKAVLLQPHGRGVSHDYSYMALGDLYTA